VTEIKPSREIDALVAEKVMGWTRTASGWHHECPSAGPDGVNIAAPPHFSTDIAAAWQVAEKLGLTVTPMSVRGIRKWGSARCNYFQGPPLVAVGMTKGRDWETAETAPMAICLAALRWVGIQFAGSLPPEDGPNPTLPHNPTFSHSGYGVCGTCGKKYTDEIHGVAP
jgi:hypothetical protein